MKKRKDILFRKHLVIKPGWVEMLIIDEMLATVIKTFENGF